MKKNFGGLITALLLSLLLLLPKGSVQAAGISVEIVAGYNLVVDSNVLSPSTYAPSVATVMGRFCNTTGGTLANVYGYIGNFGANTPGVYPARATDGGGPFDTQYPHLAGTPGQYSFTHVGGQLGINDASRFLGNLAPGECKVQYWHFAYPRRSNLATSNDNAGPAAIWGDTNIKTDDLSLNFDIWAKDQTNTNNGNATWTMTMRNEISAMANKIKPNPNGQWFNTNTDVVLPGETITSNGIDYELGVINQGFDNDGDLIPDYNAWLQPVGDPAYDPSCFRLIHTDGYLTISRSAMPDLIVPFDDQLYFTDLPTNNNGVVGRVFYTFMAMGGVCSVGLSPYQEVASGYENEKFNGDYGTSIPPLGSSTPLVTISKSSSPSTVPLGSITTYTIPFANSGSDSFGLGMTSGGTTPLVVTDAVPDGMQYVSGSATATLNYANTGVTLMFSTDSGVTWSGIDPAGDPTSIWPNNKVMIQWWLNDALPAGSTGNFAQFQARVPSGYTNVSFIDNCAEGSLGAGVPFAEACTTIVVPGTSTIGDFVWEDLDTDGAQDGGESGIDGITVYLYWDRNGDGILDDDDVLIDTEVTAGGTYDFTQVPVGDYIVTVDVFDPAIPTGYNYTTPETHAVNIPANGTNYDLADFGFGPILDLTKSLTNGQYDGVGNDNLYEGQLANYLINVINTRPATDGSGQCQYNIPAGLGQNTGGGGTIWAAPANAQDIPDSSYAVAAFASQPQVMELLQFQSGSYGSIDSVKLVLYAKELTNLVAADDLTVEVFKGATSVAAPAPYTGSGFFTGPAGTLYEIEINTWGQAWNWSDFSPIAANPVNIQLSANKGTGSGGTKLGLDAAVFVITTTDLCDGDILNPVPVTDTYDPTELEFISANPPVSSQTPGTLAWDNVGPLETGEVQPLEITFKVLQPAVNGQITTNSAATTGAKYLNGRDANDANDSVDADMFTAVTIGDTVWFDANGNGTQQAGEPGLAGVVVELRLTGNTTIFYNGLTYGQNTLIATAVTDANGNYLFEGVPGYSGGGSNPNDYSITINTGLSPILTSLTTTTGGNVQNSLDVNNTDDLARDFGYNSANSMVYGSIWHDRDADANDPTVDTNETYISEVTVRLCTDAAGTTCIATTLTDADGRYQFTNVPNNTYFVVVTPPGTQVAEPTGENTKQVCGTCNDASPAIVVNNAVDKVYGGYDFGYIGADIGDTLYIDWNGDGTQGSGEAGIPNVDVRLYRDVDGDGIVDAEDTLLETDTTDANGQYLFQNYPAGNYIVIVDTSDTPGGYVLTDDPDATLDSQHAFTTDGTTDALDVDFGYQPQGAATIGDYVWGDLNHNALQDNGETGLPNITVNLYVDDGDSIFEPGTDDAFVGTISTDADGIYEFTDLYADGALDYWVEVDEADPDLPISGGVSYMLSTNNNPEAVSDLAVSDAYLDADFGFTPAGVIGDYIWQDNDGDGEQDTGEPGIPGVTVYLCTSSPCASGNAIATAITDASGLYDFSGLAARTGASIYVVAVDTTTLPVGGFTQSGDPDRTSNCAAGGTPTCDDETTLNLNSGQIDRSRDFGYQPTAFVGDTLWIDANNNGVRDAGETGIANVDVRLCADALCATVLATTSTDSNGNYNFGNLSNTTYYVSVLTTDPQMPAGVTNTYDPDGVFDSVTQVVVSGNVVSSVGGTPCVNCSLNADFGYRYVGSNNVSGTIFFDVLNDGGIYNSGAGDIPFANIPVYLFNSSGVLIATTTTNGAGLYSFTNLPNGTFTVSINDSVPDLSALTQRSEPDNLNCGVCNNNATFVLNNADLINQDYGFFANMDCGDAPSSYNTLLADQGPCHITNGDYLGTAPDAEPNGQPNATATGDGADEDGVLRAGGLWVPSATVQIEATVAGTNGYLIAWFDWNNDGDFNDAGEMVQYGSVVAGVNPLNVVIPAGYTTGQTVNSRFRLYSGAPSSISPTGIVNGGEIEDYQWNFGPTAVTLQAITAAVPTVWSLVIATMMTLALVSFMLVYRRRRTERA